MKAEPAKHHDPRPLAERPIREPGDDKQNRACRTVTVNVAESPLGWLHARGYLTDRQLLAGEKLRGDYEAAALGPRVTMRWDAAPVAKQRGGSRAGDPTGRMIAAKERFDAALGAIGADLGAIAWRVICAGEAIPIAERAMAWPARSGKLVLRIALDRLAGFYRLPG